MRHNRLPVSSRQLVCDRRHTVLLGDADPEIHYILSQLTPPDRFKLNQSTDASELRDELRFFDVDLAVVDIAIIKQDNELRDRLALHVRLGRHLIVTAEGDDPADEVLARSLGCVLYAPKPCGYWMLHQAVTGLLCASEAIGSGYESL